MIPLHASIQERCFKIGFENLASIIWYKITNIKLEVSRRRYMGRPYEPDMIIKNDIGNIPIFRKPGYRSPDVAKRVLSIIPEDEHHEYF